MDQSVSRRWQQAFRIPAAMLAMLLLAGGTADAKSLHPYHLLFEGHVMQFGDWSVGCTPHGVCTMMGLPADGGPNRMMHARMGVEIRVDNMAALGAPLIGVFALTNDDVVDDGPILPGPYILDLPHIDSTPRGYSRQQLSPQEAMAFVAALNQGRAVHGIDPQHHLVLAQFPNDGFAPAYRAMVSHLRRLPVQVLPSAPNLVPNRLVAEPMMISGNVGLVSIADCANPAAIDIRAYRFADGMQLWRHVCDADTASPITIWHVSHVGDMALAPLVLQDPRDGPIQIGPAGMSDVQFDFDFGILRAYSYLDNQPEGRRDCGVFRAWAYTNVGWIMVARREMPVCRNLDPAQWLATYSAETIGSGPDE